MPNKHVIFFQPHHQQLVQQGEAQLLLQLLPVVMNKLGGKLSVSRWKTLRKIPPATKNQFLRTLWQKKSDLVFDFANLFGRVIHQCNQNLFFFCRAGWVIVESRIVQSQKQRSKIKFKVVVKFFWKSKEPLG